MSMAVILKVIKMPEQCKKLIDQLVYVRRSKGWTQKDLADACGLTQSVIARIENKKSAPTLTTLQRIVAALGVAISIVEIK